MTQDFEAFGLPPKLLAALARHEFVTPTPIQMEAIPLAMAGRDILGSAQTGTGKTGAFGIPILAKLMEDQHAAAIIMTPTRELATQVVGELQKMIPTADIQTALLIGGEAMPRQFKQLRRMPRLIVGTPGRINDHLDRGTLKLDAVRFLVLDETDRMLDMGFGIQIDRIVSHLPKVRQTLLFSATLPQNIVKLAQKYQKDPARVAVGSSNTPIEKITQELVRTSDGDKYKELISQVTKRDGSIIVFVKTKFGAERLAKRLNQENLQADAIHGALMQRRRDRVIRSFREKEYRILVATDIAARGLDIPHIAHVINYDLPQCPEDYIHRIGRTARAGAEGCAVNLVTEGDQSKWRAIERLLGLAPSHDPRGPANKNPKPPHRKWQPKRGGGSASGPHRNAGGGGRKQVRAAS